MSRYFMFFDTIVSSIISGSSLLVVLTQTLLRGCTKAVWLAHAAVI